MMRNILLRGVAFVLLLLALDRAIYLVGSYLRDHSRLPLKLDVALNRQVPYDVAVFGSSRTYHHFDAELLQQLTGRSTFNFGADGANFDQQWLTVRAWLEAGHQPKVVVFEADATSLTANSLRFSKANFREWMLESPAVLKIFVSDRSPLDLLEAAFVTWGLRSTAFANRLPELLKAWRHRDDPNWFCDGGCRYAQGSLLLPANGWSPPPPATTDALGAGKVSGEEPRFDAGRLARFDALADLVDRHGAVLLLVETPRYRAEPPQRADAAAEEFFCKLARERGNVIYARLRHVDGLDKAVSSYADGAHLNASGAEVLTRAFSPILGAAIKGGLPSAERCIFR
ncbi:MAG: hypothetical protein ACM31D_16185 [Bacteroidota bacterium]